MTGQERTRAWLASIGIDMAPSRSVASSATTVTNDSTHLPDRSTMTAHTHKRERACTCTHAVHDVRLDEVSAAFACSCSLDCSTSTLTHTMQHCLESRALTLTATHAHPHAHIFVSLQSLLAVTVVVLVVVVSLTHSRSHHIAAARALACACTRTRTGENLINTLGSPHHRICQQSHQEQHHSLSLHHTVLRVERSRVQTPCAYRFVIATKATAVEWGGTCTCTTAPKRRR